MRDKADTIALVEETYRRAYAKGRESALKPSSSLLLTEDGFDQFMQGEGQNIFNSIRTVWSLRSAMRKTSEIDRVTLSFVSGIAWGYHRNKAAVARVWAKDDAKMTVCDIDSQTLRACSERVIELIGNSYDSEHPERRESNINFINWITGCYMGQSIEGLEKLMEALNA